MGGGFWKAIIRTKPIWWIRLSGCNSPKMQALDNN